MSLPKVATRDAWQAARTELLAGEWGVPSREDPHLIEMLILEGAQAALSWSTILDKRESYRRAFDRFDVERVATYDEDKIAELLTDAGSCATGKTPPVPNPDPDATNELVRRIVASIPPGRVMAYGDVAALLPSGGPRTVGRIMKHDSHDLPWWRVVNAAGRPAPGGEAEAAKRYRAEGTPLKPRDSGTYVVDYNAARWFPDP